MVVVEVLWRFYGVIIKIIIIIFKNSNIIYNITIITISLQYKYTTITQLPQLLSLSLILVVALLLSTLSTLNFSVLFTQANSV
jgi:hypothetical protein